jgi:hypothetical protein
LTPSNLQTIGAQKQTPLCPHAGEGFCSAATPQGHITPTLTRKIAGDRRIPFSFLLAGQKPLLQFHFQFGPSAQSKTIFFEKSRFLIAILCCSRRYVKNFNSPGHAQACALNDANGVYRWAAS